MWRTDQKMRDQGDQFQDSSRVQVTDKEYVDYSMS